MDWSLAVTLVVLTVFLVGPTSVTERLYSIVIPSKAWAVFLLCLATLNWKGLPLVWHARVFRSVIFRGYLHPTVYDSSSTDASIFTKFTTHSRSPLWECDIMGHKSNTSYYSDLDVARVDLMSRLLAGGIALLSKGGNKPEDGSPELKGIVLPIMGGSTINYRREIAPYQRYAMETRILCWDQKWIYVVTEFKCDKKGKSEVCATAIMKLVFKAGRVTVRPEVLFQACGLMPVDKEVQEKIEVQRSRGFEVAERCGAAADLSALIELGAGKP